MSILSSKLFLKYSPSDFSSYYYHTIDEPTDSHPYLLPTHSTTSLNPCLTSLRSNHVRSPVDCFLLIHLPTSTKPLVPFTSRLPLQFYLIPLVPTSAPCSIHSFSSSSPSSSSICVSFSKKYLNLLDPLDFEWLPTLNAVYIRRSTNIPTLTRVILSASDEEFHALDAKEIKSKLIDTFVTLGLENVVDTSEYKQGYIRKSTQLILLPKSHCLSFSSLSCFASTSDPTMMTSSSSSSSSSSFSSFSSWENALYINEMDTKDISNFFHACLHQRFDFNLPMSMFTATMDTSMCMIPTMYNPIYDQNDFYVHSSFQSKLNLLDGSLIKVFKHQEDPSKQGQDPSPIRWMRLKYLTMKLPAYMSSFVFSYFNLTASPTKLNFSPTFHSCLPTVLDAIEVALVYTPHFNLSSISSLAFKQLVTYLHSQTSKKGWLHLHDVIPISLPSTWIETSELCHENNMDLKKVKLLHPPPPSSSFFSSSSISSSSTVVVYFKVIHLSPEPVGRISDSTQIIHKEICGSVLPCTTLLPLWMSSHSLLSWMISACHPKARMPMTTLLEGPSGIGKSFLIQSLANHLGSTIYTIDGRSILSLEQEKLELELFLQNHKTALKQGKGILVLLHVEEFHTLTTFLTECDLPMIATTTDLHLLDASVLSIFNYHHSLKLQDMEPRKAYLNDLMQHLHLPYSFSDISLDWLCKASTSFTSRDLKGFFHFLQHTFLSQFLLDSFPSIETLKTLFQQFSKQQLCMTHPTSTLIPKVDWKDIGGLASIRHTLISTFEWPLKYPHLFSSELKPKSGILLYGPPGTGKTLLAKALATETSLHFIHVKGPELLNQYVGASEQNLRWLFQQAIQLRPSLLFFDELDALAPTRTGDTDVMNSMVSQFLSEMDLLPSTVFLMGATNRPDLLDPAFARPGRFDQFVYVPLPISISDKTLILQAQTRHLSLSFNVTSIAELCPERLTGADLAALVSDATFIAMTRCIESPQLYPSLELTMNDFVVALKNLVPSVSEEELKKYQALEKKFSQKKKTNEVHSSINSSIN